MTTVLEPKTHITEGHLPMKYINNPAMFLVNSGLLFEINRRILHPLGMAIAVTVPDDTEVDEIEKAKTATETSIKIWDNRDDPEGIYFADENVTENEIKLAKTISASKPRFETRRKALGYVIQGHSPAETAQRAYKAYGDSTGWVNFLGKPMPQWGDLPAPIQQAWCDATAAVVEP